MEGGLLLLAYCLLHIAIAISVCSSILLLLLLFLYVVVYYYCYCYVLLLRMQQYITITIAIYCYYVCSSILLLLLLSIAPLLLLLLYYIWPPSILGPFDIFYRPGGCQAKCQFKSMCAIVHHSACTGPTVLTHHVVVGAPIVPGLCAMTRE